MGLRRLPIATRLRTSFSIPTRKLSHDANVVPIVLQTYVGEQGESKFVKWFVEEGYQLRPFDRLCEIQSKNTKATIASPCHGTVSKIHNSVGDIAMVGSTFMEIQPQPMNKC